MITPIDSTPWEICNILVIKRTLEYSEYRKMINSEFEINMNMLTRYQLANYGA